MPDLEEDNEAVESDKKAALSASILSSPQSSPSRSPPFGKSFNQNEHDQKEHKAKMEEDERCVSKGICPMCKRHVLDKNTWASYPDGDWVPIDKQMQFCLAHKSADAVLTWTIRGFPDIVWHTLPDRIATYKKVLVGILTGTIPSTYAKVLDEAALPPRANKKIQKRLYNKEEISPGYYGTRGSRVM
jgi:hypothetical protein